jgi:hypothetical protein
MISAPAAIDDQLKAVADFAAVALAILTFFTSWRATQLASDLRQIGSLDWKIAGQVLVDLALAAITFLACAAMASSFGASWTWSWAQWTSGSHVLQSLFSIIYLGFALVLLAQLGLIVGRLIPSTKNRLANRKARRSTISPN